jgi:hypothetical protein
MHDSTSHRIWRRLAQTVAVALVLAAVRAWLGPWLPAVVLAAAGVVAGLRFWWRIEARERSCRPPAPLVRSLSAPAGHVEFARALTLVAAAYLAECEGEADRP